MRIVILGWDGYIGYPLTQHLIKERKAILPYKDRIIKEVIMPKINWR